MTINLIYDSEDIQKIYLIKQTEPLNEYDLTLLNDGNGTTEPYEGIRTYDQGTEIGINAVPKIGYQFEKWVINSVENFNKIVTLKINNNITAVASFIMV